MADLVIGGRRANPKRTLRAAALMGAVVITAFVVAWFIYRRSVAYDMPGGTASAAPLIIEQSSPGAPPRLRYGDASVTWSGGLAVLRASGDAHAIGAAEGRLFDTAIAEVAATFAPSIQESVGRGGWFGGSTHNMRLAWRYRFIDDGIPEDQQRAIAGVIRGAQRGGVEVAFEDLLRDQVALDVGVAAAWSGEAQSHVVARALTFVAPQAGLTNRLWVGRSFALPGVADGGDAAAAHPIVRFVRATGRIAWADVAWPGLAGVVTGVNAEGLVVTVHPVREHDVRPTRTARPIALLARAVLEQCATLDDAIKLVDATPTLGAGALVLVDGKSGHWAVVERTPSRAITLRDPTTPAVGDILTAPAFADDLENDRARRALPTGARVARAAHLLRTPPADVAAAAAILRDRHGADDSSLPRGHRGAIADASALHTVLIDPGAMVMWVADGGPGARLRAFDLRYELRGEGDHAAPPADLPADADELADPDGDRAVRAARAELRTARRALDDDVRVADEHVARAIARAPTLPEALELAGLVARARGDRDAAAQAFARWLAGSPDDPPLEDEVRAQLGAGQ